MAVALPLDRIGERQADERALVVGEVEEIPAERLGQPRRRADDRRTLDVGADARVAVGADDRMIDQADRSYPHRLAVGVRRALDG